ncbi:endolytic transglycosylase MltG [Xylanimonas allomyrinae]|uniref:Endolytic murein transglycosylase n=1 Tax=Xylanimonas allomyrinae TaxID=2509459 RepID=A0A4P6ELX6_9MICO|nr:endolytic transglycosylase MltG [Xylanimonas allomyrinae]QAY62723.1 endolytic transglycosylase MltG [Xylanimonas allomyrinae]
MTDRSDPRVRPRPTASRGRAGARDRAAARRRRRRHRICLTVATCVALVAGVAVGAVAGDVAAVRTLVDRATAADFGGPGEEPVLVDIPAGATGATIGGILADADVVASVAAFTTAFARHPGAASIQPGTVELLTGMRAADAVEHLLRNDRIMVRVTVPEGFTLEQVLDRVAAQTEISRSDLDAAVADPGSIGLPEMAGGVVEGWLFPATYTVEQGDTATSLLARMVAQTTRELDRLGVPAERRQSIITEASIIEREAPEGYRGKVARVITNRLAIGMPLGMDAIDSYGLGIPAHLITRAQFNDPDLPFASRVHRGLPPTPIGNPGVAAIQAASAPTPGDWLWFVTVDLHTGETKFTDDYNVFLGYRRQFQTWAAANGF